MCQPAIRRPLGQTFPFEWSIFQEVCGQSDSVIATVRNHPETAQQKHVKVDAGSRPSRCFLGRPARLVALALCTVCIPRSAESLRNRKAGSYTSRCSAASLLTSHPDPGRPGTACHCHSPMGWQAWQWHRAGRHASDTTWASPKVARRLGQRRKRPSACPKSESRPSSAPRNVLQSDFPGCPLGSFTCGKESAPATGCGSCTLFPQRCFTWRRFSHAEDRSDR